MDVHRALRNSAYDNLPFVVYSRCLNQKAAGVRGDPRVEVDRHRFLSLPQQGATGHGGRFNEAHERITDNLPAVIQSERFAILIALGNDGEAIVSRGRVTIYREAWSNGKLSGSPQVALKVPFAFLLFHEGNAYDFT